MQRWVRSRMRGGETLETLMVIAVLGSLAITAVAFIAHDMAGVAMSHDTPMIQSIHVSNQLN